MSKRAPQFERRPRDFYPTPAVAVQPLAEVAQPAPGHGKVWFYEPCIGAGDLARHLVATGRFLVRGGSDIEPRSNFPERDALTLTESDLNEATHIITNPPWDRKVLHPMIEHFSAMRPTWLLFDADWVHTRQAAPFLPWLRKIVSVGRVKWIPDSPHTGKDNCAWMLFDQKAEGPAVFIGRAA